jgi:hypothetical protein
MLEQNDNLALNEDDQVGGYVDVEVWRMSKHGPVLIKKERSHNLVTNVGKKYIWRRMANNDATNTAPIFDHFRVGSGSAAATSGGTGLQTPVAASLQPVDDELRGRRPVSGGHQRGGALQQADQPWRLGGDAMRVRHGDDDARGQAQNHVFCQMHVMAACWVLPSGVA